MDILFNPLDAVADFHILGNMELIKCNIVSVGLICSPPVLILILLMLITTCFPGTAAVASVVAKASSLLLTTHFDVFNF